MSLTSLSMADGSALVPVESGSRHASSQCSVTTPATAVSSIESETQKTLHCRKCLPDLKWKSLNYFPQLSPPAHYRCRFRSLVDLHYGSSFCKVMAADAGKSIIALKCMMFGESALTATAWVVIFCAATLVEKVKAFFAASSRRKDFQPHNDEPDEPCLNIAFFGRAPETLKDTDLPEVESINDLSDAYTLCGQSIRVGRNRCTIGGIVELRLTGQQHQLLGLTTAHGNFSNQDVENVETKPASQGEKRQSTSEDKAAPHWASTILNEDHASNVDRPKTSKISSDQVQIQRRSDDVHVNKRLRLGSMTRFSKEVDWALFTLHPEYVKANFTAQMTIVQEVVEVKDFDAMVPQAAASCGAVSMGRIGSIISTSFCVLPGSTSMLEVFDLVADGSAHFSNGSSGTWIIDIETQRVYGMVSYRDGFDIVSLIPLVTIFSSVEQQLPGSSLSLPVWYTKPVSQKVTARSTEKERRAQMQALVPYAPSSSDRPIEDQEWVQIFSEIIRQGAEERSDIRSAASVLYEYIAASRIEPDWADLALPGGRPLRLIQTAFRDLERDAGFESSRGRIVSLASTAPISPFPPQAPMPPQFWANPSRKRGRPSKSDQAAKRQRLAQAATEAPGDTKADTVDLDTKSSSGSVLGELRHILPRPQ